MRVQGKFSSSRQVVGDYYTITHTRPAPHCHPYLYLTIFENDFFNYF